MGRQILRRDAIRAGLATVFGPMAIGMAPPPIREVRAFRLTEAAGLRRYGYPVHTLVPDAAGGRHYRLVRDGRPIPAQFREYPGPGGRPVVGLDFVASPGPLESSRYEVQFGSEVEPGPEPREGLKVEEHDGRCLVSRGGGTMTFEVDKDSPQFLRRVGSPRLGYLRDAGGALRIRKRGEADAPAVPDGGKLGLSVIRHGPMAVGLRSAKPGSDPTALGLELTIPSSKTWVEVVASVEDPSGRVDGLEFDLSLLIEGSPTLVDFGAGSVVYGQIRGAERMELVAGRAIGETDPIAGSGWIVRKGTGVDPAVSASSTASSPRPAEGWECSNRPPRRAVDPRVGFHDLMVEERIDSCQDGRARRSDPTANRRHGIMIA